MRTHPNWVSNAVRVLGGPHRRPFNNTSAPSSKSIFPGVAKSGSASVMFDKCFHSEALFTGCRGKSQVTRGTTIAVMESLALGEYRDENSNIETELSGEL